MKGYLPKFIGVLALVLLCAAPALALVTPSPNFYMPPSPDGDGTYYLRWKAGTSKPVETLSYVLEEATDALYSDATAIYSGSALLFKVVANPAGTYYYRVKVVGDTSAEESAYTNGAFPMVVSAPAAVPVADPGRVYVPPTSTTGSYAVSLGASATAGATYVIEEHSGPAFDGTTLLNTYPISTTYIRFKGKAGGTYYYRAKAVKAPMADSNWVEAIRAISVNIPLVPAGYAYCVGCHSSSGFASDKATPWLAGRHSNSNALPLANTSSCKNCHNANGEAAVGEVGRVTCETCHGDVGPSGHPADTITADKTLATCGKCHDGHLSYITQKVTASMHNAGGGRFGDSCQRCHTIEGFQNLIAQAADPAADVNYTAISPVLTAGTAPTCTACHDSHSGALRTVPGWDPNQNGVADQFDTCTACHNYYDNSGVLMAGSTSASNTFHHATSWYRLLPTTHYDNPATGVTAVPGDNILEGYVIRQNSPNPCFDCHSHDLRVNTRRHLEAPTTPDRGETIWTQWAQSAHAGKLLTAKEAAVAVVVAGGGTSQDQVDATLLAGSNGGEFAWNHYPWSKTSKLDVDGVTVISDRGACQMCHTATGFVGKVTDPVNYDPNNNDFSHLQDWTALTGSGQAELLYCWACHSSVESGALRASGPWTTDYTYGGNPVVYPDAGASTTCVVCHSGRGNNETPSTSSRFAGHHAPAAEILWSNLSHVGGEFAGQNYANVPYFAHPNIDVNGSGPCVACHMNANADHSFAVVTKDAGGVITGINADVCVTCHDGEHGLFVSQALVGSTADIWDAVAGAAVPTVVTQEMADAAAAALELESEDYQNAGQLLKDLVANTVTNFRNAPILNTSSNEDDRRAFQNSLLSSDEPGAFAHNRYYAKRLIFDSIDFLEDGAITGVIQDYTATYPGATAWLGTLRP